MKKSKKELLSMKDEMLDKVVKIQGTIFDRKRKVSDKTISKMKKLKQKGLNTQQIMHRLNLTYIVVRYNTDLEWRRQFNATRSGLHTGITKLDRNNRIEYKRVLVKTNKIKIK